MHINAFLGQSSVQTYEMHLTLALNECTQLTAAILVSGWFIHNYSVINYFMSFRHRSKRLLVFLYIHIVVGFFSFLFGHTLCTRMYAYMHFDLYYMLVLFNISPLDPKQSLIWILNFIALLPQFIIFSRYFIAIRWCMCVCLLCLNKIVSF